ncbi:methylmalonyl-CoA mutase subunit beta [Neobacillus bataviensis]|uniref:methylmalonyl-CoA mutase subunit beta n=1 Tax=Neobacillus bataviensis TaxID=220685 RepID=UPI001CC17EA6|nr:methylmalonyl-CoA mutase subunit beta [Neobacillus bataviensis]
MSSLENLRSQTFPPKSVQDWGEKAEQTLKGRKIESLQSVTYENIILKPLYSREDEQIVPEYPGGSDSRRGIHPLGYVTNEWKVAQRITADTAGELKRKLHESVQKGQTAISFEVREELCESESFADLYQNYPFALNSKWLQSDFLSKLDSQISEKEKVTGYIANDLISLFAETGIFSEELLEKWTEDVKYAEKKFPQLRSILINTTPYHNGGANAVQELGIAAATGVFYLQLLIEKGIDLNSITNKMVFQFSIGSNFFMEVAKLRAARVIWDRISELYGAEGDSRKMHIAAETSTFTKTITDSHVNLLRSANEAFAAVLGGVQYLQVSSFDYITGSSAFSERVARNIQLILKEEAHLQKVIDPAGGSWYIEALTNQLAEKAWSFFQQIDAKGGILEVLKSNWLQQELEAVFEKRNADIQTRKQSIVGTNVYAALEENLPNIQSSQTSESFGNNDSLEIERIQPRRLSEPFEELRYKAKLIEEKLGSTPSVGMICLGELKQYKARLDFMKGFLAAGGIKAVESKPIFNLEDARQFLIDLETNFVCFCGTNEQYELVGNPILAALKAEFPNQTFLLAGLPEKERQEAWQKGGVAQFVHVKSNCYETVLNILESMEVSSSEETKA